MPGKAIDDRTVIVPVHGAQPFVGDCAAPEGEPDPPLPPAVVVDRQITAHPANEGGDIPRRFRIDRGVDPRQGAPDDLLQGRFQDGVLAVEIVRYRTCRDVSGAGDIAQPRPVQAGFVDDGDRGIRDHPALRCNVHTFWHNSDYVKM